MATVTALRLVARAPALLSRRPRVAAVRRFAAVSAALPLHIEARAAQRPRQPARLQRPDALAAVLRGVKL
jgi:hypothetical protein